MAEIDELTKRARAIEIKLLDVVLLDAYARRVDAPEQAVRLISDLLARLRKAERERDEAIEAYHAERRKEWTSDAGHMMIGTIRDYAKGLTGGNCAFVDDDLRLLTALAKRAIDAGLTDGLEQSVLANIRSLNGGDRAE